MEAFKLTVNGQAKEVRVDPGTPLLWVLREDLKMTGTKYGCGIAACGACTVHVAGIATRSCVVPVSLVGDRPIVTIEGIGQDSVGRAVQDAILTYEAQIDAHQASRLRCNVGPLPDLARFQARRASIGRRQRAAEQRQKQQCERSHPPLILQLLLGART